MKSLESSETHFVSEITLVESSGFFDGHFPEFPLLAGVLQVHLALVLYEKHIGKKFKFSGVKNIKFFNPILPNTTLNLKCEYSKKNGVLNFLYQNELKTFSKGTAMVDHE